MSASTTRPPGHRYPPAVPIPDLPCEKSETPTTNLQRRPSFVHLCRSLLREWKDRPPLPDTHHKGRKRRPTANYYYRDDGRVLRHRSSAISVLEQQPSPGSDRSPAAAAGRGDTSFPYDSGVASLVPASRTSACTTTAYRKDSFSDVGRSPSLGARSLASLRRRLTTPRDEEMSIALSLESGSIPITHISTSAGAPPVSPLAVHAALEEAGAAATLEDQLRELAMLRRASSRASTAARSQTQKLETAVEALDRLQQQQQQQQQYKSQPSLRSCYLYDSEPPDSWIPSDNVDTGSVISIPMELVAMNPLPLSRSRHTAAAPASLASPRISRSMNDMRYAGSLRWTEAGANYPIGQVPQPHTMFPSSPPPPLPPKSRPVARAMYKIRRSFSALGAMFRHHGNGGGGSEAEHKYTQRFPSSVVPRPRAGTGGGGAARRSRLYESRCSMVIKDVSPETAAEILAPGSSYAQVLASLVDRQSVDGRSVRVSTSSRISMSTVYVQSETSDDTDSDDDDDDDGYQGAKQTTASLATGGQTHISKSPTPHNADTKTLKRQAGGGGVSVRTALRVDTTIKVRLRRSMSEPHMTPRRSSSRANDSLPSPLIPRSQIERVPWKALGHAASFPDLDAESSSSFLMSVPEIDAAPTAAAPPAAAGKGRKAPARPEQATYEKELATIDANINKLKERLAAAQNKFNGTDNVKDAFSGRRQELRTQLDAVAAERKECSDKRSKLFDQMKALQASLKKTNDDTKSSKDRLGYKSVEEVDAKIVALERQQQSGEASLQEEKRIVAEISNLKKAKKILEGLTGQQASIEDEKKELADVRAQLAANDPERDAIREKFDALKAELSALDDERKEKQGSLNDLWNDRRAIKAELDEEYSKMRAHKAEHKRQNDEWYNWQREESQRKKAEYAARLREDKDARLAVQAEKELEAAAIPAYTDEINQCTNLIRFLESFSTAERVEAKPVASSAALVLPEGAVVMKKKDDEDFMVLGNKKGKKGGKRAQPSATKPFKLDFDMIDQFVKLKFDLPTSAADIAPSVAKIQEKKQWYIDHQAEATAKAKAAAEKKIAALRRGEEPSAADAPSATEADSTTAEKSSPENATEN
ncbi:hypothetical protein HDU87_005015 [Geranomyces variabilis]|uniref:Uncharacterized protein n=1 Tax=Geranomyces variabilis TaxID=109894 RepID=A0AAD5TV81_9FUNG|nr:hypothetical protein HDU87_005015 [Geranomyces variabilis]